MDPTYLDQMRPERLGRRHGQHRRPILSPLALPHDNLVAIEIEVLDAKIETFLQPEPRTVEQHHDQTFRTGKLLQDRANLLTAEYHGQALRGSCPHNGRNRTDPDRYYDERR